MVEGKLVRLEFDPLSSRRSDGKDRYSRTLAYVFLQDGRHLNAEIIRQGYGFAVSSSPPLKYQNEFGASRVKRGSNAGVCGLLAIGQKMVNSDGHIQELLVSSLAQTNALANVMPCGYALLYLSR
jgi:hypothetical protein